MPALKAKLLSGRTLNQAKSKVSGKFSKEYIAEVAICEFNPDDLRSLEISPGQNVRVTTKVGSVVVRATVASQATRRGVVFMPYGPWVNMVLPSNTYGTGMPSLKGVDAVVTPAIDETILDLPSLIKQIKGR